jgi:hypothetical protein
MASSSDAPLLPPVESVSALSLLLLSAAAVSFSSSSSSLSPAMSSGLKSVTPFNYKIMWPSENKSVPVPVLLLAELADPVSTGTENVKNHLF